jgi:hypothetical protein
MWWWNIHNSFAVSRGSSAFFRINGSTRSGRRRVSKPERDAAEIGASLEQLLNHKDPHRDEAAGNVDPPQRTPPSDRGQLVRRFRPAVIIVLGLIVEPGFDRLRSRWWR